MPTLWAATSTAVFRTEDGGAHWTQISDESYSTTPLDQPQELVAVPGALYVVTWQRLLASTDGGRTWESLYDQGSIRSFAASSSRTLYLAISGDPGGLLQSRDGGQTWAPVTSCPPAVRQIVLAPAAAYVAVEDAAAGLLRSTDLGRIWRPVLGDTPSRRFDVSSVAVDPRAPRTPYVSGHDSRQGSNLWVSHDSGKTWVKAGPSTFSRLRIDASTGILYGDYYGYGLQRSLNGGATWATVLRSPDSEWSEAARINFRPGDPARAALAVGFVLYRSVNGGATWKLSGFPDQVYDVDLDPADPNRLIASAGSALHLSEDAGRTWHWAGSSGSASTWRSSSAPTRRPCSPAAPGCVAATTTGAPGRPCCPAGPRARRRRDGCKRSKSIPSIHPPSTRSASRSIWMAFPTAPSRGCGRRSCGGVRTAAGHGRK